MAQSFWGGFAEGLGGGINYGLQIQEAKERKRLREEARKKAEEIQNVSIKISQMVEEGLQDGTWDYDDYSKTLAYSFSVPIELQDRLTSINNALLENQFNRAEKEIASLDAILSDVKDMSWNNPEAIDAFWNNLEKQYVSSEAKKRIAIAREYTQAKHLAEQNKLVQEREKQEWEKVLEIAKTLPQEVRPEYLRQKGIPIPEVPTELQRKFAEIDKMPGLPEDAKLRAKLKALGISESPTEEKIRLAYQMGASDEDIRDYIILGKRPTTAGTATAQKETQKYSINDARVISDAMDLYDFVTSAYGAPTALTEEQKQNILQSVQSMQAGLQPPVYTLLVNMLDMGGYLPSGTPTPAPENKKESSLLQDAVSWVKAKFNQWFTTPTTTPETQGTKNYQNMTDDELYNLVVTEQDGLAYDELKRRGYPLP